MLIVPVEEGTVLLMQRKTAIIQVQVGVGSNQQQAVLLATVEEESK